MARARIEKVNHPKHYGGADNPFRNPRRIDISQQRFGMLVAQRALTDGRWQCLCDCGSHKFATAGQLRNGKTKSCGCRSRSGPFNGRWKGGRLRLSSGYVRIHRPQHPRANALGYVLEHHLVMETKLGRFLRPEEEVHHKNGRRSDNEENNLELWTASHPKGVRVTDLYAWAKNFVERYREEQEIRSG